MNAQYNVFHTSWDQCSMTDDEERRRCSDGQIFKYQLSGWIVENYRHTENAAFHILSTNLNFDQKKQYCKYLQN